MIYKEKILMLKLEKKFKECNSKNNNNFDEDDINDESMKKLNEEFKKMEKNYRELIKNKDKEYNKKRYFGKRTRI